MKKFLLLKSMVNETKEKRVYIIDIKPLTDVNIDEYIKTIIEKWKRTMIDSPYDFKLPDMPYINYDITYR